MGPKKQFILIFPIFMANFKLFLVFFIYKSIYRAKGTYYFLKFEIFLMPEEKVRAISGLSGTADDSRTAIPRPHAYLNRF